MSGVQPANNSAQVSSDLRTIFEQLTYGPAPEADNVAQVYADFNCHLRLSVCRAYFVLVFGDRLLIAFKPVIFAFLTTTTAPLLIFCAVCERVNFSIIEVIDVICVLLIFFVT